jgi:plasmid stabilization system protein ParE
MAYAVELTRRAERDLDNLYEFLSAEDSKVIRRWFNGLENAIYKLQGLPRRCPRAPESRRTSPSLRHFLYGSKPNVYRVLYEVDESRELVRVLTIRHGARDAFTAREPGQKGILE